MSLGTAIVTVTRPAKPAICVLQTLQATCAPRDVITRLLATQGGDALGMALANARRGTKACTARSAPTEGLARPASSSATHPTLVRAMDAVKATVRALATDYFKVQRVMSVRWV